MPSEKAKVAKKTHIKIVVRRLPHGITQEELLQQLDPIPEHKLFWFCKADLNLIPFAFSRAYFVFLREEDAIAFVDRFNGYVFVDKLGYESIAIVELAPYQEIIDNKKSAKENDKRVNTLEEDAEYIQFLKEYDSAVSVKPSTVDEILTELEEKQKRLKGGFVQRTPLTDFVLQKSWLKEKKNDRRQAIRQNRPNKEKEVELKKETSRKARKENKKERSKKEKTPEEVNNKEEKAKKESIKKVFTSILKNTKKFAETAEDNGGCEEGGPSTKPDVSGENHQDDSEKSIESGSEKKFRPFKVPSRSREIPHKTDNQTTSSSRVEQEKRQEEYKETHDRKNREKVCGDSESVDKTASRNKKPERAIYKPPSHRTRSKQPDKNTSVSKASQNKDESA